MDVKTIKISLILFLLVPSLGTAQEMADNQPVELNGDVLEYSVDGNVLTATGNVTVSRGDTSLFCDKVQMERDKNIAYAQGNVRLVTAQGEISGEELTFNFNSMTGDFHGAKLVSSPYYGSGAMVSKIGGTEYFMQDGYMTTCDLDKPHFQMASKKMDIYMGEKIVARHVKIKVGSVPIMYIPKMTQRIDGKEPFFEYTPGYSKDWGAFILTKWRYQLHPNLSGKVYIDAREKRDLAYGFDTKYKVPNMGDGIIKTYFMKERRLGVKRFYSERLIPTVERERFRVLWRHKWRIDKQTEANLQYNRISDNEFLKDYFEREHRNGGTSTYFLLNRNFTKGNLSYYVTGRVNRFEEAVARLPEVRYDLENVQIGESKFYVKNTNSCTNFVKKFPSPSETNLQTMRLFNDTELSYLTKVGIFEFKPFVGTTQSYYSKLRDQNRFGSIRGLFKTGASISTKFYKIVDVDIDSWWIEVHKLRHVITPSIAYNFSPGPTIPNSTLDQFDSLDSQDENNEITFSLENKLQTKRNGQTVDLLRSTVSAPFPVKNDPSPRGFSTVEADIEYKPIDWLTLYFDSVYDTKKDHLNTANFDLYINGDDDWTISLSKRFNRRADDQIEVGFFKKINPKWSFRIFDRFDLKGGNQKDLDLTITRDLHEWLLDLSFRELRGEGSEILLIWTLKAHPDLVIEAGTGFNKRKAGTQSKQ